MGNGLDAIRKMKAALRVVVANPGRWYQVSLLKVCFVSLVLLGNVCELAA